jgi:hypothetical protein
MKEIYYETFLLYSNSGLQNRRVQWGQKGYIISKFLIQHMQYQQFYFDHSHQMCRGYWQSLAESLDMEQLALNKDLVLSL